MHIDDAQSARTTSPPPFVDCQINDVDGEAIDNRLPILAVSIASFCRMTSLSKTSAYQLIRDKKVQVARVGRRTLILMSSVEALIEPDSAEDPS